MAAFCHPAANSGFPAAADVLLLDRNRTGEADFFNNSSEVKAYLASTISWKRFAERVPELDEPLVADASQVIFVARAGKRPH